ncbi:DUF1553 domain-containing protein [Posidoniimonas polymericola]|nr:DUF1553 domain-containing protein [Posidoniimonas polymericola]
MISRRPYDNGLVVMPRRAARREWRASRRRLLLKSLAAVLAAAAACIANEAAQADDSVPELSHLVRPILSDKCFYCHGPDEANRPTDLRMDTPEGIRQAFDGGLKKSLAWRRIAADDDADRMPPAGSHKPLTAAEKQTLQDWVAAGAVWSPHWAFVPPVKAEPPREYSAHPVDAFVRRRLHREGLAPSGRASREKLIRRVTFDLHGLPPTIEEIDDFVQDTRPDAWGRVIDRLLASPRYGERMAVSWLDGARYADTNGYQNDFRRTMWPWRDWVINAFNRNMPFDQFTIEQIAGDLLPEPTNEQRIASGFNRNNRTVTEAGSIPEEWLVENVIDRVETTSTVFLGLTMGCARCHDHKFDPISQQEFYEFYAFFNNIEEEGVYSEVRGNVGPVVECLSEADRLELARLESRVRLETKSLAESRSSAIASLREWAVETPLPRAIPTTAAVRLDGAPFAAVAEHEKVVSPNAASHLPKTENAFLGPVATLEGDQWLEYEGLFEPHADRPFTLTAWVKRLGGGVILSKMADSDAYRGIDWMLDEGNHLVTHFIDRWPESALKMTTKKPLAEGVWTHVAVAYDGSSKPSGVSIFFGAEPQPTITNNNSLSGPLQTGQPFRIGRRSGGSMLHGSVARIRVFDYVLSGDELSEIIASDLLSAPATRKFAEASTGSQAAETKTSVENVLLAEYSAIVDPNGGNEYAKASSRLEEARRAADEFRENIPTCMVMQERETPRETFVLSRGQYNQPDLQRQVFPSVPTFLGALPSGRADRLALAEWIVSRDNPLTARVVANRLWGRFFGRGLVKTEENLGVQCDPPSHPELLDWLAVELMDSGWDLQHLTRLVLTSKTYQQSTVADPERYREEPDNRLLERGPRRRLQAEFVRDQALSVGGLLTDRIGGASVFPYQPSGLWDELAGGANEGSYKQSRGPDLYRRSLYTYRKRTVPHPTTAVFDAPGFEICTVKRSLTNTPLQALALLNDPTYVEAARKLAERMILEGGQNPRDRVSYGFRLVTSRRPSELEVTQLCASLEKQKAHFAGAEERVDQFLVTGDAHPDPSLDRPELAAYAIIGSLLLNLDESITTE